MRRREGVGLTALMDAARMSGPPEPWHLGFLLGPRINAGGRIGRADLGVRLLLSGRSGRGDDDRRRARPAQPRAPGDRAGDARRGRGGSDRGARPRGEGRRGGHRGARLASGRGRAGGGAAEGAVRPAGLRHRARARAAPAPARAARSPASTSARRCAAPSPTGCSSRAAATPWRPASPSRRDRLAEFRAYLEETLGAAVEAARRDDVLLIDGALTAEGATPDLIATIARAGPFGAGNAEPVFALPSHTIAYAEEIGQAHVRVRLKAGDGAVPRRRSPSGRPDKSSAGAAAEPRPAGPRRRNARASTAGRAPSGCSCASAMLPWENRLVAGEGSGLA